MKNLTYQQKAVAELTDKTIRLLTVCRKKRRLYIIAAQIARGAMNCR